MIKVDLSVSESPVGPVYGDGGKKGAPLAGSGACRERRSAPDPRGVYHHSLYTKVCSACDTPIMMLTAKNVFSKSL